MTRRVAGLAFVVLLLAAATLSVLVYRKTFTSVVTVTLETDHTGLQLTPGADVKVRDVLVGEVRDDQEHKARKALDDQIRRGGTIRVVAVPDVAHVAASYFGAGAREVANRPKLSIELSTGP